MQSLSASACSLTYTPPQQITYLRQVLSVNIGKAQLLQFLLPLLFALDVPGFAPDEVFEG